MTKKSIKEELNNDLENMKKDLPIVYQLKKNVKLVSKYKRFNVNTIEKLQTDFPGEIRTVWKGINQEEAFRPYNYIYEKSSYGPSDFKDWQLNLSHHNFYFSMSKTLVDWADFEKEIDNRIEYYIRLIAQTENRLSTIDWDIARFNKLATEFTSALETFKDTGLYSYANQVTPRLRYESIQELVV